MKLCRHVVAHAEQPYSLTSVFVGHCRDEPSLFCIKVVDWSQECMPHSMAVVVLG